MLEAKVCSTFLQSYSYTWQLHILNVLYEWAIEDGNLARIQKWVPIQRSASFKFLRAFQAGIVVAFSLYWKIVCFRYVLNLERSLGKAGPRLTKFTHPRGWKVKRSFFSVIITRADATAAYNDVRQSLGVYWDLVISLFLRKFVTRIKPSFMISLDTSKHHFII